MKILNVTSISIFPPDTGGGAVVYRFLKYLSKKHEIYLLTVKKNKAYRNDLDVKLYDVLANNKVGKFLNPLVFFHLRNIIRRERPDLLIIDFPWYGVYGFLVKIFYRISYIIREHNVEYIRLKRLNKWWWRLLKWYEKFILENAQQILCITDVDKALLAKKLKINHSKVSTVPYGVDTGVFRKDERMAHKIREKLNLTEKPFILFFGKLDYQANLEAIEIIRDELIPRVKDVLPYARFVIVGKNPPTDIKHKDMIFTGVVAKIEDYINASDFVICPLLPGGGIRTRIIESIACGKIVITTSAGAEGITQSICEDRLIVVDDWDQFSKKIINLVKNAPKDHIPTKFIEEYSWEKIIDNLRFSKQ